MTAQRILHGSASTTVRFLLVCASLRIYAAASMAGGAGEPPGSNDKYHSNWVVITTINYPTETIKLLAAAPNWQVVVVADKKTPADWALDDVILLSMEVQKSLKYSIMSLLPFNHYGRKNIGYLYAIENGATQVYETDDDNEIISTNPLSLPSLQALEYYVYNTTGVCNPYQYFGYPNIWPRGYPLDQIKAAPCNSFQRKKANPLVLQGLANLDPDVDAIYRLTQPLGVHFKADLPAVVLPQDTISPWNSQNTLFARDALWGLLIPITTTFRVCDIWRSYWVQRLLWEIGGNVAFGPPTVNQLRNAHNLMRDFEEEIPLYNQANALVKLLNTWEVPAGSNLPNLMTTLAQKMADDKMWEQGDVDLMAAWVADLRNVGYEFPRLRNQAEDVAHRHFGILSKQEGPDTSKTQEHLPALHTPKQWRRYDNIVAIIMFNSMYANWLETYKLLKEAYTPIFGNVIFTGFPDYPSELPSNEKIVTCSGTGHYQYICFANAIQEYSAPPDGGYLIIGDDTIINHCQIHHFNTSKIWFPHAVKAIHEDIVKWANEKAAQGDPKSQLWHFHSNGNQARDALKHFTEGISRNKFASSIFAKLGSDLTQAHFGGEFTDGLYIPMRLSLDYLLASAPFGERKVQHEVALPAIFGIITSDQSDFQVFKSLLMGDEKREWVNRHPEQFLIKDGLPGQAFMLHPYKFSYPGKDLKQIFWDWWAAGSCLEHSGIDDSYKGLFGISASLLETKHSSEPPNLWSDSDERLKRVQQSE